MILAAGPRSIAEQVVIERTKDTAVLITEGAHNSYMGYVTVRFSPDNNATVSHHTHYAVEVSDDCSPTIDHCTIHSSSIGMQLFNS